MKKAIFFVIVLISTQTLFAQDYYSYVSDKRFKSPEELIGYTFIPNVLAYIDKENPQDAEEIDLAEGEVSFFVTDSYLYVKGEEIEGSYSIVSINAVNYGFILKLINAQNPSIQGHLKIILNKFDEADMLIFKPSNNVKEIVFYQAIIPKPTDKEERDYFTDRGEVTIVDSTLWKTTLYPFFEIAGGKQKRIQEKNKWLIQFSSDSIQAKKKIVVKYFVEIDFLDENEEGVLEPYQEKFEIGKVAERMNKNPKKVQNRYALSFELKTGKIKQLMLFLDDDRNVNSLIIGNSKYLMRGVD